MNIKRGSQHVDQIAYFVVRESERTCEIEVQDAPILETREDAERWIAQNGIEGVDYWICRPVHEVSIIRKG